ncbi:MAG: hypothetical protein AMXMBFR48_09010 [Ignavibacteriales bacterium]
MAAQNQKPVGGPKTSFGRYMVYNFIPNYANNVQGLVYMGAALLIIIVGLRGLGTVAYDIPIVPKFLFDEETHKVAPMWVMTSLFLEFALLMVLAIVTFFTPEDAFGGHAEEEKKSSAPLSDAEVAKAKQTIADLRGVVDAEMKVINDQLSNLENINKKLTAQKNEFYKSISELRQVFKS